MQTPNAPISKPSSQTPKMQHKEFIVLMAMLMSIVAISIDAILPALDVVRSDFALANANHAQYLIGLIFIGMAVGQLVWGPLSDAKGRKPVLYAGILLYLAGSVICYLAPSFEILLAGRLIQGLGVAGPYVTSVSVVRDKYAGRDMAQIMSVIMMIFIMVPAIAPSLGQGILYIGSWRSIFVLYIGYALAITVWLFFRMEETLAPQNRISFTRAHLLHGLKEVVSNRVTIGYTICMGICFGSFIGYLNSSQQIFQSQFGTGELFTVYFGVLALVLGVASLANSRFVQRLGMHYICVRAFGAIVLASALFLSLHLLVDITLWMFLAYAVALFFSFGLVFGNLNAIAMEPMGHIAGIASAITGAISSVMSLAIGGFIGQLYNNTLVPMTTGFFVLGLLSLATMFWAEKGRIKAL